MSERIRKLEQFVIEDPTDPFNLYALALEYVRVDEDKALGIFSHLLKAHKDYLPTYYQLANLYGRLGARVDAVRTFQEGMLIAKQQRDFRTLSELNAGLEALD